MARIAPLSVCSFLLLALLMWQCPAWARGGRAGGGFRGGFHGSVRGTVRGGFHGGFRGGFRGRVARRPGSGFRASGGTSFRFSRSGVRLRVPIAPYRHRTFRARPIRPVFPRGRFYYGHPFYYRSPYFTYSPFFSYSPFANYSVGFGTALYGFPYYNALPYYTTAPFCPSCSYYPPVLSVPSPPLEEEPYVPTQPETTPSAERFTLLAFKDHTIVAVTDYWLKDDMLYYRTSYEGQTGVPLDRLDFAFTERLNSERGVRFVLKSRP